MGLIRRLKSGIEDLKGASYNNYDKSNHPFRGEKDNTFKNRMKAEKLAEKQEIYEEREKGRRAGAKKAAYEQGYKQGKGNGGGGFGGGWGPAVSSSLSNTEKVFGGGGSFGLSGDFFGVGIGNAPAKKPASKTTRIVTGGKTITIRENTPIEPVKKVRGGGNWMEDLDKDSIF